MLSEKKLSWFTIKSILNRKADIKSQMEAESENPESWWKGFFNCEYCTMTSTAFNESFCMKPFWNKSLFNAVEWRLPTCPICHLQLQRPPTMHQLVHPHESQGSAFSLLLALCCLSQKSLETNKKLLRWMEIFRHRKVSIVELNVTQWGWESMQENSAEGFLCGATSFTPWHASNDDKISAELLLTKNVCF